MEERVNASRLDVRRILPQYGGGKKERNRNEDFTIIEAFI